MGSVKSAHRRAGKVKGIDRFLGTMETASQDLMETSSGKFSLKLSHKRMQKKSLIYIKNKINKYALYSLLSLDLNFSVKLFKVWQNMSISIKLLCGECHACLNLVKDHTPTMSLFVDST